MMLIPFVLLSQEEFGSLRETDSTTVSLEYLQDVDSLLRELERRRAESKLNNMAIAKFKGAAEKFERLANENKTEAESWKQSYEIIEGLYEAEKLKEPKSNWFIWSLGVLGAFFTGYFVGSL